MSNQIIPFSHFRDEYSREDVSVRINAVRRLPIVVYAEGVTSSTTNELVTIIEKILDENEDDEIFLGMAECLSYLFDVLPLTKIIIYLEKLLGVEESSVRTKTVQTYGKLIVSLSAKDVAKYVVPSVQGLFKTISFISHLSAICLLPEVISVVDEETRIELIKTLTLPMEREESLILKRTLVSQLALMLKHLPYELLGDQIFNVFKRLCLDDSDNIRISTISALIELAKVFTAVDNKKNLIPLIIQLTGDKSWRVRHHLASEFHLLASAVGSEITDNSFLSIFSTLLRDSENEVRIQAVRSLKKMVTLLSTERMGTLINSILSVLKDSIPMVRIGCCDLLREILTRDLSDLESDVLKKKIEEVFIELVNDCDIEVKMGAISALPLWARYVGNYVFDLISSGAILIDYNNPSWRVRKTVIGVFLELSALAKSQKIFDKVVKRIFLDAMEDKAYEVRKFSVSKIPNLVALLDPEYILDNIYKPISNLAISGGKFYTYRLTSIIGLKILTESLSENDKLRGEICKTLLFLVENKVSNIRMVAVKALIELNDKGVLKETDCNLIGFLQGFIASETDREIKHLVGKALTFTA